MKSPSPTLRLRTLLTFLAAAVLAMVAWLTVGNAHGQSNSGSDAAGPHLILSATASPIYDAETPTKWLSPAGNLIGIRQEAGKLILKIWKSDGSSLLSTQISLPQAKKSALSQAKPRIADIRVAVDASAIAWTEADRLFRAPLLSGKLGNSQSISISEAPESCMITTDGDVWYARPNGQIFKWSAGATAPVEIHGLTPLPSKVHFQEQQVGDFLVLDVPSGDSRFVRIIRKGETGGPFVSMSVGDNFGASPLGIVTVWGHEGISSNVYRSGITVFHPSGSTTQLFKADGWVTSVLLLDESRVLVAGAFSDIYSFSSTGVSAKVFNAPPNSELLGLQGNLLAFETADSGVHLATITDTSVRTSDRPSAQTSFLNPTILWISAAVMVVVGAGAYWVRRRRPRAESKESPSVDVVAAESIPLPAPPSELIQACANGECVFYVGAGVGAQSDYPTWKPLMEDLLNWSIQRGVIDPSVQISLRASLSQGEVNTVADAIVHANRDHKSELDAHLKEVFQQRRRPSAVHKIMKELSPAGILTTNLDRLLEGTFEQPGDRIFTSADLGDAEKLLACLTTRQFFLAKLYGDLDRPNSVLLGPEDYAAAMSKNFPFSQFMDTLFYSRTLFFVGASLEGIQDYLSGLVGHLQGKRSHFALVAVSEPTWKARADLLARRYNIHVLPFTPSPGFPELLTFLQNLEREVKKLARPVVQESVGARRGAAPLKRVTLENVGPFASLEFQLDPHWNVLLGDNGVGKSTILKAMALAISGKDAEPYAARVVNSRANDANITLETNRDSYRMEIRRKEKDGNVRIQTFPPSRPLDAEGWLAIAFPPLRTTTWQPVRLTTSGARIGPTTDDLIPIATGDLDPRMDKLKEWIAGLDLAIKTEKAKGGQAIRQQALLDRLFVLIEQLTPGANIHFHEVTTDPVQVLVKTNDGVIPIEAISQGAVSLISWVGVVLKRLYEVYGDLDDGTDPTQQFAIVIVDEIDAHMHPEWQQMVIQTLTRLFPNVQFIASTHSPLIVAGLPAHQILRFARDENGRAVTIDVGDDFAMGTADQLLTSRLFGLKTTVDPVTQTKIEEYRRLLGKTSRSKEEEQRFRELEAILRHRIPPTGETPARRAQELLQTMLLEQMGHSFPEGQQQILKRAMALLEELEASSKERKARSAAK